MADQDPKLPDLKIRPPDLRALQPLEVFSARQAAEMAEGMERVQRSLAEAAEAKSAKGLVKRILDLIRAFEMELDDAHEVGVRLVSFGQTVVFHVTDIGYVQPHTVVFSGLTDDKQPVRLIQHMSQVSFLLMKVPRLDPHQKRRPIGYHGHHEKETTSA